MKFQKILNYVFLIAGLLLYTFIIITSGFHVYGIYEMFEKEESKIVALFVTIALEVSILFITYVFYSIRNLIRFKKYYYMLMVGTFLLLLFIWFLNYIYMEKNFNEQIILLKTYDISFLIPLIASFFIPFSSIFLSISIIIVIDKIGFINSIFNRKQKTIISKESNNENNDKNNKKK